MLSAFPKFLVLSLVCAGFARGQVNPHTQIRWPAGCSTGSGKIYNQLTNSCVDMNSINPATQLTWPVNCATPNSVYVPAANVCVVNGTANNPAGGTSQVQTNQGGSFYGDNGFTYTPSSQTLGVGGIAPPAGFASGIIAAPAFYDPHGGVNVLAAGAKGDCTTDDHDAITRAINAALANANNPLPIIFPQPPGSCYLTSTLTWRSVSMRGLEVGYSNQPNQAITLKSMPGQDLWLFPDPNDVSTVINKPFVLVENMQWLVDSSVDSSASHPHRKPGRTMDDGVTNATTTVTSNHMYCNAGDVGQPIMLTYPDTTTQTSTIASCSGTPGVPGTSITMAAAATQSQSGVGIYITPMGIPVADRIGNCALAVENRDQNNQNWKITSAKYPFQFSIFRNLYIASLQNNESNHSCGIYLQGYMGSGYANTWEHIRFGDFVYGFVMAPSDTNPTIAVGSGINGSSQGCDYCRYIDWNLSGQYPFIAYNGQYVRIADWQLATKTGPQFLGVPTAWDGAPLYWEISMPEQELITTGAGFRIEGNRNILRNITMEGVSVWDANYSTCDMCAIHGSPASLAVNGRANKIMLNNNNLAASAYTSADPSNLITLAGNTSGKQASRQVAMAWSRSSVAGIKSADFLRSGARYYNNKEDLWLTPTDVGWGGGVTPTPVADANSESGYYVELTAGNYESWWASYAGSGVGLSGGTTHAVIGGPNAVLPAQMMTYFLRVKCPVITSFGLSVQIRRLSDQGIQATISLGTPACSTGYTTITSAVDLTPYDGALYYVAPAFALTGAFDWAWDGWIPAGASKTCPAGQHISAIAPDGTITCSADSGGTGSTYWVSGVTGSGTININPSNVTQLWSFFLPYAVQGNKLGYRVGTVDNTANLYDIGIYPYASPGGGATTLDPNCHIGPTAGTIFANASQTKNLALPGMCVLNPGNYVVAVTTNCTATCAALAPIVGSTANLPMGQANVAPSAGSTTTGGTLNTSITVPAEAWGTGNLFPLIMIHQ